MIPEIAFASCYVYSPAGEGPMCERSRLLSVLLKEADDRFMLKYALRVREQAAEQSPLAGFFGAGDVLVPVPGCKPKVRRARWAAADLAEALVQEGLGTRAWPGLRRVRAVRKSATAAPPARPTVALHYDSFWMECGLAAPASVMLIDDVITRGRTLLAAASRVHEAFPSARIRPGPDPGDDPGRRSTLGSLCGENQMGARGCASLSVSARQTRYLEVILLKVRLFTTHCSHRH